MRTYVCFIIIMFTVYYCSCNSNNNISKLKSVMPGTVIDKMEMPVLKTEEDKLNDFIFSIAVSADSQIDKGIYDVTVQYKAFSTTEKFTMPKGIEQIIPEIRIGAKPYTYIIGFVMDKDTTFNEYFEVSAADNNLKMQYIKAYTFQ